MTRAATQSRMSSFLKPHDASTACLSSTSPSLNKRHTIFAPVVLRGGFRQALRSVGRGAGRKVARTLLWLYEAFCSTLSMDSLMMLFTSSATKEACGGDGCKEGVGERRLVGEASVWEKSN